MILSNGNENCIYLRLRHNNFGTCGSALFVLSQGGVNERSELSHICQDIMESTYEESWTRELKLVDIKTHS